MRKISDLFARSEAAAAIKREDLEGGVASLIDYRIIGEGVDQMAVIADFYNRIDFPRSMRDGNLAHVAGTAGDQIIFSSVWDTEANAITAYQEMGPDIERTLKEVAPQARVERSSTGVYRFSIGDDADEFNNSIAVRNPECVGYLIDIPVHGKMAYDLVCNNMGFPAEWPEGLLMHVAGPSALGWRTFSMWRTVDDSLDFLEQRLMPGAVGVVREQGLFPEIRPLEVKPFLFALNSRMLN
ncbi:MAG: hypothetical protein ACRDKI_07190 [Solirubrobacterales bacterium]